MMGRVLLFTIFLAGLTAVTAVAGEADELSLPDTLPDGASLRSTKDVFTEVADGETAQQLRDMMPHLRAGTEYRYVLERDGQTVADWGILAFTFDSSDDALSDFQNVATQRALVNKEPYSSSSQGLENLPGVRAVLDSNIPDVCIVGEAVVMPLGASIIWVDNYQVVFWSEDASQLLSDPRYDATLLTAADIAEAVYSANSAAPWTSPLEPTPTQTAFPVAPSETGLSSRAAGPKLGFGAQVDSVFSLAAVRYWFTNDLGAEVVAGAVVVPVQVTVRGLWRALDVGVGSLYFGLGATWREGGIGPNAVVGTEWRVWENVDLSFEVGLGYASPWGWLPPGPIPFVGAGLPLYTFVGVGVRYYLP